METKKWYQSKTVWAGLIAVAVATYNTFRLNLTAQFGTALPEIPEFVFGILGFLGLYGRTTATTVIK